MTDKSILKSLIYYAVCLILTWVLIGTTWGATLGYFIGMGIAKDKALQEEMAKVLKDNGIKDIDISKSVLNNEDWYKNLPPQVRIELDNMNKRVMKERILPSINWFGTTLAVSAFVFALVGFFCGFINRNFVFVGIIVVMTFIINNPITKFAYAKDLALLQKFIVVVFAQFGICYLFGYLGARLRMKHDKKSINNVADAF